jgi:hypothetical protein
MEEKQVLIQQDEVSSLSLLDRVLVYQHHQHDISSIIIEDVPMSRIDTSSFFTSSSSSSSSEVCKCLVRQHISQARRDLQAWFTDHLTNLPAELYIKLRLVKDRCDAYQQVVERMKGAEMNVKVNIERCWVVREQDIVKQAICGDGRRVNGVHRYTSAEYNPHAVKELQDELIELRKIRIIGDFFPFFICFVC